MSTQGGRDLLGQALAHLGEKKAWNVRLAVIQNPTDPGAAPRQLARVISAASRLSSRRDKIPGRAKVHLEYHSRNIFRVSRKSRRTAFYIILWSDFGLGNIAVGVAMPYS